VFAAIAVFVFLFVELVRADQLAIRTAREIAEFETYWNRVQLQVLGAEGAEHRREFVDDFRRWALDALDRSRLAALAATTPEVERFFDALRGELDGLTTEAVARAAEAPFAPDAIDGLTSSLRSWMDSFVRGQARAFRLLLVLYGAVLLGSIGVAMTFARDLWRSQRQGHENRLLAQRFIRIREDERTRLAAELHDDAAQSVASAAMIASSLAEEIGEHPHLQRLQNALDSSLATIRSLSRDLGVTGLREVPLERALDQLLSERSEGLKAEASYEGLDVAAFSGEQKLHLHRIVQECLTNTVRHAAASRIRLRLVYSYPNLVLRYSDDGIGFHPSGVGDDRPHLGLRSMSERARILGGELAVTSKPGEGTRITLVVPVGRS
jgi:signal transduction histidine kinase